MIFLKIKNRLKEEISEVNYNRYIDQLEMDETRSKSNLLFLYAQNIFIANHIKRNFTQLIAKLYEEETGISPDIRIQIKNKEIKINYDETIKEEVKKTTAVLIPEFDFNSFVVGSSNQFAFNTAKAVAENPGRLYNPLFIYGGVGLGKTHLIQAIGNFLKENSKIIYVTSEQFLNDFTYHIRNQSMDRFHEKYRNCDVLLIDDIQFISGKDATQEEFFHTFNELYNMKKQICLTADMPPKRIIGLADRLKSRFESGLIVDIQPPELETKIAIIKKKCDINGIFLTEDVINFIATTLENNIREIEGMITKINAMANIVGQQEIDLDFAKQALKEHIKEKRENITLDNIVELIAKEFNIKPSEITSKSRNQNIVLARRTAIYLARHFTKNSTPNIAKFFGLKDHSAVSKSTKAFNKKIKEDGDFHVRIKELESKVQLQKSE